MSGIYTTLNSSITAAEIVCPTPRQARHGSRCLALALLAAFALPACALEQPVAGATEANRSALDGQEVLDATDTTGGGSFAKYIAFGDSFSSGFGERPGRSIISYLIGTCTGVSKHPWPKIVWEQALKALNPQVKYEEQFCAGHKIADMSKAIAKMSPAPANTLITFTIGGNDTGVSSELQKCLSSPDCQDVRARVLAKIQSQELRDGLGGLVDALRAKAPSSTILMAGYPHVLAANPSAACVRRGVTAAKVKIVDELIDKMNALIHDVAIEKNSDGAYANVTVTSVTSELVTKFKGHEACAPAEWIGISSLMHPGAKGHLAYAQVVAAALGGLVSTRIGAAVPDATGDDGIDTSDSSEPIGASDATDDASDGSEDEDDDEGDESGEDVGDESDDIGAEGSDDESDDVYT